MTMQSTPEPERATQDQGTQIPIQDEASDVKQEGAAQQGGVAVVAPGQRTHGPECDGAQFFSRKGDQQADEAGREHGEDHADQDDRVRRQRTVELIGKAENNEQR